jgi:methionine biosynthesis protein MetW
MTDSKSPAAARADYGYARRRGVPVMRPEYDTLVQWTPPGSRVLDVGCGEGSLGARLIAEKGCVVHGIEIDPAGVDQARLRGIEARVGDADAGLDAPDGAYDIAIMNVTLFLCYRPRFVMSELLRVAPVALVSFVNFAHWLTRLELLLAGRYPHRPLYGYPWYETRHIHMFSWSDYRALVRDLDARVTAARHLGTNSITPSRLAAWWPNLFSMVSIARVERRP